MHLGEPRQQQKSYAITYFFKQYALLKAFLDSIVQLTISVFGSTSVTLKLL